MRSPKKSVFLPALLKASGLLFLLGFLCTTGCSKTEWAVHWSDTYLAWKLNSQFDLKGESKKQVKGAARDLVKDLRHNRFPEMAQFFQQSANELSSLSWQDEKAVSLWVDSKTKVSESFLHSLRQDLEPFAIKVASQIQRDNWLAFQKEFAKDNARLLSEKSKCSEKMGEEMADWLGDLSAQQEEQIHQYCETRTHAQELRAQNREHLMQSFRKMAEPEGQNFDSLRFQTAVRQWVQNYPQLQLPLFQESWKKSRAQLILSLSRILVLSSPGQREKFKSQLESRAQSLLKLSKE